jgi:type I restriction enzyme S subunit
MNLHAKDFFNLLIRLPNTKAEQQAIAAVLQTADEEITNLESQLDALETQKRGLMQKLLTGTVRVKF